VRWANDPEFAWCQWGRGPGRFRDAAAVREWWRIFPERDGRLFVIEHPGGKAALPLAAGSAAFHPQEPRPIGFVNYCDWRPKPRSCEVGIGIGERALWSTGLGRDALRTLMRHLVDDLGAHRITLDTLAFNDRAVASYRACGFDVEGILRDEVPAPDGTYLDAVLMAYVVGRTRPAFDPTPVTLEGDHVRLEALRMEHAAELFAALRDADWTFVGYGLPEPSRATVDDMAAFIRSALDRQILGEHMPWITRRVTDGRAIGTTRYGAIDRANRSVEIGWTILGPEGRRTVANTEAKYLQLRHAFETLGAVRVWLKTDVRNERSRRAIERIGAKLDGIVRNERLVRDGHLRDACYYSFIDRDWPEAKARLEALLAR
jgi:RimJ/RimL family protein N-acetyltransferase